MKLDRKEILDYEEEMSPDNVLVSIVIITYNSGNFILEALESAADQNYKNLELIISDDCSQDNTVELCRKWLAKNKQRFSRTVILTNELNTGISPNLNRGLYAAKGEWLKLLAGDDALNDGCISSLIEFVRSKREENIQLIHGSAEMYEDTFEDKNLLRKWGKPEWRYNRTEATSHEQYEIMLRHCPILAPTVFIKSSIFNEVGYFDEDIPFWEDRPMWLKVAKAGYKFYFIDAVLALYRVHSKSVQKAQDTDYFSKYEILKEPALKQIILPNLSALERFLHRYIIVVRRIMIRLGLNRKTKLTHYIYRGLVFFVEKKLNMTISNYVN